MPIDKTRQNELACSIHHLLSVRVGTDADDTTVPDRDVSLKGLKRKHIHYGSILNDKIRFLQLLRRLDQPFQSISHTNSPWFHFALLISESLVFSYIIHDSRGGR